MESERVAIDVYLEEADAARMMAEDVRRGLSSRPKEIPPKYFYDERGSWLFERITELPEYYPTRAERSLLKDCVAEVAAIARPAELVELGPGSAAKTHALLQAGRQEKRLRRYLPFDVSATMIEHSAEQLGDAYPWLEIHGLVGDFEQHLGRIPPHPDRLVAFLGSTIGNFVRSESVAFLKKVAGLLNEGGYLLLGTDLVKDRAVLEAAYNDSEGVTADFNRNVLRVINDRLEGDFDPERFEHVAYFNERDARIEMHLESSQEQTAEVKALDLTARFEKGERMRTEVSCKYTRSSVKEILGEAGFALERWFTDPGGAFALSLSTLI